MNVYSEDERYNVFKVGVLLPVICDVDKYSAVARSLELGPAHYYCKIHSPQHSLLIALLQDNDYSVDERLMIFMHTTLLSAKEFSSVWGEAVVFEGKTRLTQIVKSIGLLSTLKGDLV